MSPVWQPGDRVRLTRAARTRMFWQRIQYGNGSQGGYAQRKHVQEFRRCVGIVQGLTDFGTQQGPEYDVRWQPSNLRYCYDPADLELV